MNNMKARILVSGGIDSMACINFYLAQGYDVEGIFFDYKQRAEQSEHYAAMKIAKYYGIKLSFLHIPGLRLYESGEIPGRNAIMAVQALGHFGYGTYKIVMGIHSGTNYPDCSAIFVEQINRLFDVYTDGTVILEAPFLNWTKQQIIEYSKKQMLPVELTYSCECGNDPCGRCNSCLDRKKWLNETY